MTKLSAKQMAARIVELIEYRDELTTRQAQEVERVYSMTVGMARALRADWIRNLTLEGRDELAATLEDLESMAGQHTRGTGGTELHAKCGHFVDMAAHKGRCEKDEYRAREVAIPDPEGEFPDIVWIVQRGNAESYGKGESERMTEAQAREIADWLSNSTPRPVDIPTWRFGAEQLLRDMRAIETEEV